ncbi:MAG: oxidoreductase [Nocardioidaceae bacterium]|nr:oxidoreductase [Nocardioidaceae bacterium]MCL2613687.1 oxidoreductase [Nocardioidaceae bacterium]
MATRSWTADQLPDLTGKVALVTGGNSGIGLHTARALAAHGADVVIACRNVDAATEVARRMPGAVGVERLDLASQASVEELASRWERPLDLLIDNAGVMSPPAYRTTADRHELMFGTNHLGHFALTGRLLPALLATPSPRVVTVASIAHFGGTDKVLEANPEEGYRPGPYYSNSKLANLLFARELQRRAAASGSPLTSTAAHPGISATGLVADPNGMGANGLIRALAPLFMPILFQSAVKGADPTLYAATEAAPGSYTGPQGFRQTRGPIGEARISTYAADEQLGRDLWALSERLTGVTFAL